MNYSIGRCNFASQVNVLIYRKLTDIIILSQLIIKKMYYKFSEILCLNMQMTLNK